jgi:hypothetical protein
MKGEFSLKLRIRQDVHSYPTYSINLIQSNKFRESDTNRKGRSQIFPVSKWHDLSCKRLEILQQNTLRPHKRFQQSSRIQNEYMNFSDLPIHQKWSHRKRKEQHNPIHKGLKRTNTKNRHKLTKDVKDLYNENKTTLKRDWRIHWKMERSPMFMDE